MICYKPRSKQMPVRLFLCCAAPCEVAVVLRGWWEVMELVRAADYAARRCALFLLLLRCNDVRDALEEACPCKLLCLAAAECCPPCCASKTKQKDNEIEWLGCDEER